MRPTEKILRTAVAPLLIAVMVANLASCGTILHPERKGQKGGNIDPAVAVLDAVGLLFFIIPGVIAFAVDFTNGTIYLPHGRSSSLEGARKVTAIHIDGKVDEAAIERAIHAETGVSVDLRRDRVEVVRLSSPADLEAAFAAYQTDARIAAAQ